jgi:hypothetical protein
MLIATILFAGSSALSKWLVATYPIGEMLFVRAATALIGSSLVILPVTGLAVFRTKRLRDHMVRGISQSCAQTFLVVAFSLMPLASAVAQRRPPSCCTSPITWSHAAPRERLSSRSPSCRTIVGWPQE